MKRLIKEKKTGSLNLELLGYDCWWQKPTEVVRFALPFVEGKPLVVARIPQQIVTTAPRARAHTHKKKVKIFGHQIKLKKIALFKHVSKFSFSKRDLALL